MSLLAQYEDLARWDAPPVSEDEGEIAPYDAGWTACIRGIEINPYRDQTARAEWLRGWMDSDKNDK